MDKSQFNEWLQKHQKAYPALVDWFAALPDQKGTLAIWLDVLSGVSPEHAREATMRMIRGTEPLVKFNNWHDTPRFITEHATILKRDERPRERFVAREIDGMTVYRCRDCFDSGIIEVFHGHDVRRVRAGKFGGKVIHRAARACTCDLARERYRSMIASGDLKQFNPQGDVRFPRDRTAGTVDTLNMDIDTILSTSEGPVSLDDWASF